MFLKYLYAGLLLVCSTLPVATLAAENKPDITNGIHGSGSQPLARLYVQWAAKYQARHQIPASYTITNVVQGMLDLESGKADYAGTEIPQSADELKQKKQFQFPTALVAFTPFVNIAGIHNNQLVLDAGTLAGIFMGKIKRWNDPQIVALNPKLPLPNLEIKTVHRNTGNTITYVLSAYLSKTSPEWAQSVGTGTKINWPVGQEVDSNEDLIAYVRNTQGAIGFSIFSLVKKGGMNLVRFQNNSGNIVSAAPESIMNAAANTKWDSSNGFSNILINIPGANTWPFVMTGFITVPAQLQDKQAYNRLISYFDAGMLTSPFQSVEADLVPLPDSVIGIIRTALKARIE